MERFQTRMPRGAPYALLTLNPVLLGTVYAVHDAFPFRPGALALCLLAALAAHLGAAAALAAATASGGRTDLVVAAAGGGLALLAALALVPVSGAAVLGLAFAGLLLAALYVAHPLPLRDAFGLGEIAAAVVFGPLLVSLGYCAQSGELSAGPLLVSLPLGTLTAAAAFARHFEHAPGSADPLCPVLRLGESQARLLAKALALLGTLTIALGVRQGELSRFCLVAVVPAVWAFVKTRGLSSKAPPEVNREQVRWIAISTIATGLLILAGLLLAVRAR